MSHKFLHIPALIIPMAAWILLGTACQTTVPEAQQEETAESIKPHRFSGNHAPKIPTLAEGGFSAEPAFVDTFDADWEQIQDSWHVLSGTQNHTAMDPSRCQTNEAGYLVQTVMAGMPYRGGSVQGTREFGYGRWLARVRPSSVPGVLNSIFTKDWDDLATAEATDDGLKAEVDIEFLSHTFGNGRGQVHLAIHLLDRDNLWWADVNLDFDPSGDFNTWGFDILPDRVVWHVNGQLIHTWMYSQTDYVDPGYEMFFNSWTWEKWVLGPPTEDAHYHIDWVRFYPLVNHSSEAVSE